MKVLNKLSCEFNEFCEMEKDLWYLVPVSVKEKFLQKYEERRISEDNMTLGDHIWIESMVIFLGPDSIYFKYPIDKRETDPKFNPSFEDMNKSYICKIEKNYYNDWFIIPLIKLAYFKRLISEKKETIEMRKILEFKWIDSPNGLFIIWPIKRHLVSCK